MAAKPKKMTDAEKAKLKKDLKQVNLDKPKTKKASTSYSPRAYVTGLRQEMYAVQGAQSKKKSDARIAAAKKAKAGSSTASKVVKAAKKVAEYTPAGMAAKGAKTIVKAARGGMSVKEENKKLGQTIRNIGKAGKK
jgi:hypothetical protein